MDNLTALNRRIDTVPGMPPSKTTSETQRFLTLAEVSAELNCSMSQIYALVRSGELRGIQIGGRNVWRVERVQLEDYIQRAYQRTAQNLADLPAAPPDETPAD